MHPTNIDVLMSINNLIDYCDIYSETNRRLWKYYRNEPALNSNNKVTDFPANNNHCISFKLKEKITAQTGN